MFYGRPKTKLEAHKWFGDVEAGYSFCMSTFTWYYLPSMLLAPLLPVTVVSFFFFFGKNIKILLPVLRFLTEIQRQQKKRKKKQNTKQQQEKDKAGVNTTNGTEPMRSQPIHTYPLPQRAKPQLFREIEPGNFSLPNDLLLMI